MQAHPWQASGFSVVNRFVGFDCNWGSSRRWGFGDLVYWREVGVWLVNWLLLVVIWLRGLRWRINKRNSKSGLLK
jgi:hypothetical protein